ncbi:MAG TPA: ATP-dependent DNA ligase [Pirellulales bacterium]|nr:ATP-dependent DNA ligase [Pirellulales bacterium]
MQAFTELYFSLDSTNRTSEKVRALEGYFTVADPHDAAWALFFLTGHRVKRAVNTRLLREWVAAEARLPLWLVEESYDAVGDLAETLALLLPEPTAAAAWPLHRLIEERLVPLPALSPERQRQLMVETWRSLDVRQRLVWHKLITGEFRVGVAATLVIRALAEVAQVPPPVMAHRLTGDWQPTADAYRQLIAGEHGQSHFGRPYPFFLAHPLQAPLDTLGDRADWRIEWKWDGIRAQLIRRGGEVLVWTRGEELVTERYPELAEAGGALPDGTVLDGEILAWKDDKPLPFAVLQRRIGRKRVGRALVTSAPVAFMAFDLLERAGQDCRDRPFDERRRLLEEIAALLVGRYAVRLSRLVEEDNWEAVARLRERSREFSAEGLMLKRRASAYGVGRPRGDWWKWKIAPWAIDAVLIYAQRGNGRRASLYSDYTFGVWHEGELIPVAKAYSGLTDEEIREVDRFVRDHTLDRHGPVRVVQPELVFELHFDRVQLSKRHKGGVAVRFPRMARWRRDKKAAEADTLETVRKLADPTPQPPEQPLLF